MPERYADIVLPLAREPFTFAVGAEACPALGTAVAVPLGRTKILTGIVWRIHGQRPDVKTLKPVGEVLYGGMPLLTERQMALWEWIAEYYMCTLGEVMRAALPALMKPSGRDTASFGEEVFRPRRELFLSLASALRDPARLAEASALLHRAPRQRAALEELISALGSDLAGEVPRRLLGADRPMLAALERRGYVTLTERVPDRDGRRETFRLPVLTASQEAALASVGRQFADRETVLLYGVTGSGKTEIYMHLIARTLLRGEDVLLLVPEIVLTSQLVERMERTFGDRVTVYHSRLTDRRRTETYLRLCRSEGGELVLGARSSLFLPLKKLGLVVVDEEHDPSYKQAEPAPRYHARDCAVVAARLLGARTLLGSATPSLESWLNARAGKYGFVRLDERYGDARPPEIRISDTLRAVKRGERHSHFNNLLLDAIAQRLERGEQTILYQNRRGFAPYVACRTCGWTARCPDCNVTLTYHKQTRRLECHYCGHTAPVPTHCPDCRVTEAEPMGFGTEKIELEGARLFPQARAVRLDRDSVTSERAFQAIVRGFARREWDVLIGTQMVTKGFDFEGVTLVGILNADNMLNNPDFRASERAFQQMMQVAGRAGRRERPGEVVIQTAEPDHPVIRQVAAGDYEGMALQQLAEREAFFYPPYARLVALTLRHRDAPLLGRAAVELASRLRGRFGRRVNGPVRPAVDKIRGEYLLGVQLRIECGASFARARKVLREVLAATFGQGEYKSVTVVVNVDPQ